MVSMKCLSLGFALAATSSATELRANPIRKVVTMLQKMQEKVEAEGEKEKELFDKFMCYCKTGTADLEKSIAEAEEMITELPGKIEEGKAELTQTKADIKKAKEDRTAAKAAMDEATAIREKEAAVFAKASTDYKTNLAAIKKAVGALEAGMEGSFLQTAAASVLRNLVQNDNGITDIDRDDLTAFLSEGDSHGYAPASGQIVGILKQMGDTMAADLADITKTEKAAKKDYDALMAAKTKEVDVLTAEIEEKTERVGKLGEDIVAMEEDLSDAEEGFEKDKKFLKDLQTGCETKEKEWDERCKMRNEELLALSDTIKILNDDDALEMFKKTLPAPEENSFLQVQVSQRELRSQAAALLTYARQHKKSERQRLDMVLMAIQGKKVAFDKIIKLIDDMVTLLGKEQEDDDNKKEYCEEQFDLADDKKKELLREDGKLEKAIAEAKEFIKDTAEEIKALTEGIEALDKSVAEATDNRKEENSDYKTLMANNGAAKEIMEFAKNRLNKFYNPKLYKPEPADAELAQVSSHDAPPPPPETFGAYAKQGEGGNGVIAKIDMLIKELDTEMTEAETEEKLAQEEYEEFMADSKEKRAADAKSVADKETAKGDTEDQLAKLSDTHKDVLMEIMATEKVISNLHGECDWLLKYFDVRKQGRAAEADALKKAKAVLSGADYSFMQMRSVRFLHRA
jgi:chromosome segregation ATPase